MTKYIQPSQSKAFSMTELTLILAIIGLIISSLMLGRGLVTDGRVRSLIMESDTYISAIDNFSNIYNCFPGDCATATTLFGTTDVNGTTINNGNGNGQISTWAETLGVWQHLMAATLIPGTYDGGAASSAIFQINTNVPGSAYGPGMLFLVNYNSFSGNYPSSNVLELALIGSSALTKYEGVAVLDASIIDLKTDDSKPYTGRIISYSNTIGNGACVATQFSSAPSHSLPYLPLSGSFCNMAFATSGFVFK